MNTFKNLKKTCQEYFYDHPKFRVTLEYLITFIASFISAGIFAYGYKSFISPTIEIDGQMIGNLITGGASGLAQIFVKIFEICGFPVNDLAFGSLRWNYILQSVFYVMINIPVLLIAYFKIGKKFCLFTLLNVIFYFIIVNILPENFTNMFYTNGDAYGFSKDFLARAIFAGICTGLCTVIAFKFDHSAGGIDVVSVYVQAKKNDTSIGKISMFINICIIVVYTLLSAINAKGDLSSTTMALYSCVYFFTSSTVIDALSSREKKHQLQIITDHQQLPDVIIKYFPHSCTIVQGKGAYTKKDKLVIYTVLSSFEVKKAIKIIREVDSKAFVTITKVSQVVGRFYIQPRK